MTREMNLSLETVKKSDQRCSRLEDELAEYQEKRDNVAQWDSQIAELIHWYVEKIEKKI